jgi:hypothetical protein
MHTLGGYVQDSSINCSRDLPQISIDLSYSVAGNATRALSSKYSAEINSNVFPVRGFVLSGEHTSTDAERLI